MLKTLTLAALLALPLSAAEIKTLAGTGVSGASGDGGAAVAAQVGNPYGLTIGPDGALYVCEIDTHRIRRIDLKTGKISTVAGTGAKGYSGDGGPATQAEPAALTRSASIEPATCCSSDEERDRASRGQADRRHFDHSRDRAGRLLRRRRTGDEGAAQSAPFDRARRQGRSVHRRHRQSPHSQARHAVGRRHDLRRHGRGGTDAGRRPGRRHAAERAARDDVRQVRRHVPGAAPGSAVPPPDSKRQVWRHIAGTGEKGYTGDGGPATLATLSGPKGIEVGPDGGVYIADTESHTIRRIDLKSGLIETVAGVGDRRDGPDGDPLACGLARPHGVYVDGKGTLYIGDSENHRVRMLPR